MSCDGLSHVDLPELDPDLADPEPGTPPVPATDPGPVPATGDPGSGPVPSSGPAPVPAGSGTALAPVPDLVTLPARLPLTTLAWQQARRYAARLLAIPGKVWDYQPETMRDHSEYVKARRWMGWASSPDYDYLEGWVRALITGLSKWGGVIYGRTAGPVLILTGMWIQEMGRRPSKLARTLIAVTVLVVAWKLRHWLFS